MMGMYSLYDANGALIIQIPRFSHAERYARTASKTIDLGIVEIHVDGLKGAVSYFLRGRKLKTKSAIPDS